MMLGGLTKRDPNDATITRFFQIDDRMYDQLVFLSEHVYRAKVTALVAIAVEYLITHEETIQLYQTSYAPTYHGRTYNLRKSVSEGLDDISARYSNLSYTMLVNIAVHNLLEEEAENLREYDNQ